ncbi:MAG: hypothetical protein WD314_15960 [Trueperaceae bacterium]
MAPPDTAQNSSQSGSSTLSTASHGVLGPYLVDGQGRALYLREALDADARDCSDECSLVWPPFLTPSIPSAGDSLVAEELIGSTHDGAGMSQVTYNGHPLHYYVLDDPSRESPKYEWTETLGQVVHDEWGRWFLVTPEGEKLERLLHSPPTR